MNPGKPGEIFMVKKYKYQALDKFVRIVITTGIVCICLLIGLANTP